MAQQDGWQLRVSQTYIQQANQGAANTFLIFLPMSGVKARVVLVVVRRPCTTQPWHGWHSMAWHDRSIRRRKRRRISLLRPFLPEGKTDEAL